MYFNKILSPEMNLGAIIRKLISFQVKWIRILNVWNTEKIKKMITNFS